MKIRAAIPLLVLAIYVPNCYAGQYLHPKLKAKEKALLAVVILPAKAEVSKEGVKGSEPMSKESEELGIQMMAAVAEVLKARGVEILGSTFTPDAIQSDPDLQSTLTAFQTRYDALATQLHKKPKDVTKGRYTLGDEVTELKVSSSADAFVVIRASGMEMTKGKAFLSGGLLGMAMGSGRSTLYYLAVVDSRSGEILFFANDAAGGKPEDLTKALTKTFSKLPR